MRVRPAVRFGPNGLAMSRALAARAGSLPLTAVCALGVARAVDRHLGAAGFGEFSLVLGLTALMPFSDLGLGVGVTNMLASGDDASLIRDHIRHAFQKIAVAALVVIAVTLVLLGSGLLGSLLGGEQPRPTAEAAATVLVLYAISMPFSLGGRIYLAAGRSYRTTLLQTAGAVLSAALVVLAVSVGRHLEACVLLVGSCSVILTVATFHFALRNSPYRSPALDYLRPAPGTRRMGVRGPAGPMLVIGLALPIGYQSDRIILSHLGGAAIVATYSIGLQLFNPAFALVGAGGQNLWPHFIRLSRAGALTTRKTLGHGAPILALGAVLALGIAIVGPWVASLAVGRQVARPSTFVAFAALLLAQTLWFPFGMSMMEGRALRLQAGLHVAMVLVNLPLSVALTLAIGPTGPIYGSTISIVLCLIVPRLVTGAAARPATGPAAPDIAAADIAARLHGARDAALTP